MARKKAYDVPSATRYDIPSSMGDTDPRLSRTHEEKVEAYQRTHQQTPRTTGGAGFYGPSYGTPRTDPDPPVEPTGGGQGSGQGSGQGGAPSYIQQFQSQPFTFTGTRPTFDFGTSGLPTWTYESTRPEAYQYEGLGMDPYSYGVAQPTPYLYQPLTSEPFSYDVTQPKAYEYKPTTSAPFSYEDAPEAFEYEQQAPQYKSQYDPRIQAMLDQILGREKFSYDYTTDPLYQQYAEAYTRQGQQAMQDTLAQVSARTGGLASSYAGTAAQAAYGNYMQALADKIPELTELARSMYRDEGQDMYQQLSMLQGLEDTAYGRYRDQYGDWQRERDFQHQLSREGRQDWETGYDRAWQQYLAQQEQERYAQEFQHQLSREQQEDWERGYDRTWQQYLQQQQQAQYEREFQHQLSREQMEDWREGRDFDWQQYLQQMEQRRYDQEFQHQLTREQQEDWDAERQFAWQQYLQQGEDYWRGKDWEYRGYQDQLDQYEQEYARQYAEWQDAEDQRYRQYLAQLGGGSGSGAGSGSGSGSGAGSGSGSGSGSGGLNADRDTGGIGREEVAPGTYVYDFMGVKYSASEIPQLLDRINHMPLSDEKKRMLAMQLKSMGLPINLTSGEYVPD